MIRNPVARTVDWWREKTRSRRPQTINELAEAIVVDTASKADLSSGLVLRHVEGPLDVVGEFGAYGEQKFTEKVAEGNRRAASAHVAAEAVKFRADDARKVAEAQETDLARAQEDFCDATRWLSPFVRRAPGAHHQYVIWMVALLFGDAVGVLGGALTWGETWVVAIGQALSSGFAAVAAGWVGADVRDRRDAQTRAAIAEGGDLEPGLVSRFPLLFAPVREERDTYGLVLRTAALVVGFLATGIFALRCGSEGLVSGVTFGALAIGTALASFINSWRYADHVADLLARTGAAYDAALNRHRALAGDPAIAKHDASLQEAAQIEQEYAALGMVEKWGVRALLYGVLRRNANVYGHGELAEPPTAAPDPSSGQSSGTLSGPEPVGRTRRIYPAPHLASWEPPR